MPNKPAAIVIGAAIVGASTWVASWTVRPDPFVSLLPERGMDRVASEGSHEGFAKVSTAPADQ